MSNTTSSPFSNISLNLGGGLIEIAALTALIGSTTAESLVLGNQGAAGLPWATMSIFGALSVIKACIAAATPDWLRETIGVRNKEIDAALGLAFPLNTKSMRSRQRATGACGVACRIALAADGENAANDESVETSRQDVYTFDQCTAGILDLIPESETTNSLFVYILIPDAYHKASAIRNVWKDWLGVTISTLKSVELLILWKQGATSLALISGCSWGFFFVMSVVLNAFGLSREYSERVRERNVDVIAGQLPTPIRNGGHFKILLGAPQNVRHSLFWRLAWSLGSLVCTVSVITTYMTLGSQGSKVFAQWTGFHFLWLGLRSVFYHFAESTDRASQHPILQKKSWKSLNPYLKERVRRLVGALSLYQMHVHPRCFSCYYEDAQTIRDTYNVKLVYPLMAEERSSEEAVAIHILEVVGDTLLSSASFITGSKRPIMDLYDTCAVVVKVNDEELTIPAARVLSGKPPPRETHDPESGWELPLAPRGGSNEGKDIMWWYWVPCGENKWLELSSEDMKILGERKGRVLSDEQVTKHLMSGVFYVSISDVRHVEEIVGNSREAFDRLEKLLDG